MALTSTIIIPTYNRPEVLYRCLQCVEMQTVRPDQVLVVDASKDTRSEEIARGFAWVTYLRNERGRGNTPHSRNCALRLATGDIVAFLDDDSYAHSSWLAELLETYRADSTVDGVAGRALNGTPNEATQFVDDIGKLKPNGFYSGNFAADPGRIIEVDHMLGCNMSLRRDVLAQLGGFRDEYPAGPFGICEETELCVRARRMGHRLVFNPAVCVDHVGAPQPTTRRFGPLYVYYHHRNSSIMLVRNFGAGASIVWRFIFATLWQTTWEFFRRSAGAATFAASKFAGTAVGMSVGLRLYLRTGNDPVRQDPEGLRITAALTRRQFGFDADAAAKSPDGDKTTREGEEVEVGGV